MSGPELPTSPKSPIARLSFTVDNADDLSKEISKMRRSDVPATPLRILSSKGMLLQKSLHNLGAYENVFGDVENGFAADVVEPFDLQSAGFAQSADGKTSRLAFQPQDIDRYSRVTSVLDVIEPATSIAGGPRQYMYIDFATESLVDVVRYPHMDLRKANPLKKIIWLVKRRLEEERGNPIKLRLNPNLVIGSGLQYNPRTNRIKR
jgi:hypothetical protein